MDADELYTLRNAFFLGNYQEALAEADTIPRPKNDALRLEKDVLVYRSHIGLGDTRKVISEIRDDAAPALQAVKLLAQFSAAEAGSSARASVLSKVEALVEAAEAASASVSNAGTAAALASAPLVLAMAGSMYLTEGHFERALRAVKGGATLELLALSVQVYLRLDRPDLAEGALKTLQERDDESALYQLSAAHTYTLLGGDKAREAVLILKDVMDRYGEGAGPGVANALAAAYIAAKRYADAEKLLAEADASYPETLINSIAVAQLTGKPEAADKALAQLRKLAPKHPYVQALAISEGQFERVAASFAQ